jgi:hypothetical protein
MNDQHYAVNLRGVDTRLDDAHYALQDALVPLRQIARAHQTGELDPAAGLNVTLLLSLIGILDAALNLMLHVIPDWLPDPDYR